MAAEPITLAWTLTMTALAFFGNAVAVDIEKERYETQELCLIAAEDFRATDPGLYTTFTASCTRNVRQHPSDR